MSLASDELYAQAIEADRHLLGPDQRVWLDWLDDHRLVLQSLLQGFIDSGDSERALTLVGALSRFWWMRENPKVGREWCERVLQLPGGSDEARAKALVGAGSLAYALADFRESRRLYESALPLLQTPECEHELAHTLERAGMAARQLMDLLAAQELHFQAWVIQRRKGSLAEQALCLNNLGVVAFFRADMDMARDYHNQALALREQAGDIRGKASSLNNLGQVELFDGNLSLARDHMDQGLALRRQLNDRWGEAGSHVNLAIVHARMGNLALARTHLRDAVAGFRAVSDPLGICECLDAGAELAHAEGRLADMVRLIASATVRREQLPAPRSLLLEGAVREVLAQLRVNLGDEVYDEAWRKGSESSEAALDELT